MNNYKVKFTHTYGEEYYTSYTSVKGRNKIDAINRAINRLVGWREKDRITNIEISEEHAGNKELTYEDYK
ncbi:hypothetical protein [Bacillus altitudinis]|uniref:hypothetical protein n=1 Tax=Bacillus altitudinis TaxID=293387 RepID=UPI0039BFF0B0